MESTTTHLLTAEEFYDFCHLPENRDRCFELESGEVVELNRPNIRHGVVCANVARILGNYVYDRQKGYIVSNDAGLIVERDPDTVNGPDVFLYDESRPFEELPFPYDEQLPALIVEVLSPSDRLGKVVQRVTRFLDRGTSLVWVLDPEARNLTLYRPEQHPVVYEETEEVTGFDILPDLKIRVADFFATPGGAK
ncbi:MAG: Uma2 family endonuclease [Planctomycetes bacterium]|nr:Uma2 family endonuclease [Planctomycetota bacterium]